jgi:hypothetical protein
VTTSTITPHHTQPVRSHPPDLGLALVLFQTAVQVVPPLKQHALTNELEPWCELVRLVPEHVLELGSGNVFRIANLVRVDLQVDVGLDEQDVVDLVLAPLAITGCLVVYPREEVKLLNGHLFRVDAKLLLQLALRRALYALDGQGQGGASLGRDSQRVGAACVGPEIGECDLLGRSLLQEQAVLGVEEEDGERAVQEAFVDVLHEVANLLAGAANRYIVLVQDNAHLVHQTNLLFIVTSEITVLGGRGLCLGGELGIDLGEEAQDVVCVLGLSLGGGSGGTHVWW